MKTSSRRISLDASDDALIQQFKDGSADAFSALYRRYLPLVYKRVSFVVPIDDVEDVTQEVFIAAFKSLPSFRGQAQFSTWLRSLAHRKVVEFYRRRNRKQEAPIAPLSAASRQGDGTSSNLLEQRVVLQSALEKLPENYREIILLRIAEGLQFHEIAEVMGQSLEAVKSLYRRAIMALKEAWSQ